LPLIMKNRILQMVIALVIAFNQGYTKDFKDQQKDSILLKIANETDNQNKIANYLELIRILQNSNLESSLNYCDSALAIAKKEQLKYELADINIEKVRSLYFLGRMDEADTLLLQIEKKLSGLNDNLLWGKFYLVKNLGAYFISDFPNSMEFALISITYLEKCQDTLSLCKAYNNIGVIYETTGNRYKAIENYLKAQEFAKAINQIDILADLYNNIGILYYSLGNSDQALVYYYKSLEYSTKVNYLKGQSVAFLNIASLNVDKGRTDDALVYFNKAMEINKEQNNPGMLSTIYHNMGEYFLKNNQYDSAYSNFQKAIQIYNDFHDTYSLILVDLLVGDIYMGKGQTQKALAMYLESYRVARDNSYNEIIEMSAIKLSQTFQKLNDYKNAYKYQAVAFQMADSSREYNKKEQVKHSELQIEFKDQSIKYESEIEKHLLTKNLEHQKKLKERYFFILVFVLGIAIVFIIIRNLKKSAVLNTELIKQNKEIEHQKELIEISNLELKEQYTFTETLLNTIPNPVFYTDKNSVLLGCNMAFEEIAGKKADEIIGCSLIDLNVKTQLSCDTTKLFSNPGKDLLRNEGTIVFTDQKEHDVISYRKGIVNSDGKLIGTLGILIDITDIRKAERNLKFSQGKLKEALSAKDKFFNIMAHDLKNPFNAILGLTSIISENYDTHSPDEIRQYVKLINQSANQVYNLLENLLEWARTQSGSIEKSLATFPVNDVIMESVNLFGYSLEQKKLKIELNTPTEFLVYADQNMSRTVMRNLLSNAIKYSQNDGKIVIALKKEKNNILVSIIDHGVGIRPESIEKLFKIDQPLTTPGVNNERGTGLGLIICQEFIKQNGGTLSVKSELGKGSTFTFSLPSV